MVDLMQHQFSEVHGLIKTAKEKVFRAINVELINLYWQIGEYVHHKVESSQWGKSVVHELSEYIRQHEPDIKGFSAPNIWRMKQFFEAYQNSEKLSALVREISWTNNMLILAKSSSEQEREFYLLHTRQEKYSSRELERQIDSGLFERVVLHKLSLKHHPLFRCAAP